MGSRGTFVVAFAAHEGGGVSHRGASAVTGSGWPHGSRRARRRRRASLSRSAGGRTPADGRRGEHLGGFFPARRTPRHRHREPLRAGLTWLVRLHSAADRPTASGALSIDGSGVPRREVDVSLGGRAEGELRASLVVRHREVPLGNHVHPDEHISARNIYAQAAQPAQDDVIREPEIDEVDADDLAREDPLAVALPVLREPAFLNDVPGDARVRGSGVPQRGIETTFWL